MAELSKTEPIFDTPLLVENITDECAQELVTATVTQAIEDHTRAFIKCTQLELAIKALKEKDFAQVLRFGIGNNFYNAVLDDMQGTLSKQKDIVAETERFFLGQDFEMYSSMSGKDLIEILKKHESTLAQDIIDGTRKRVRTKNVI